MDETPNDTVDGRFPMAGEISNGEVSGARSAIDKFRRGLTPISDSGLGNHSAHEDVHEALPPIIGTSDWYKGNTTEKRHVAEYLKEYAGLPGIKYLDQGSRGPIPKTMQHVLRAQGEADIPRTSNYVVFNDKIIDILRKYGLAGGAVGAAAASAPRDAYAENEKNRESLKNAPASFDERFAPVNAQPGIRPENMGGVPFHRFPSPPSRTEVV